MWYLSYQRYLGPRKSGRKEMFNCVILTPSTGFSRIGYSISLFYLTLYYAKKRMIEDCPDQVLRMDVVEGSGISANRESLIDKWLKEDVTHFLFIDEDMTFQPQTLHVLASRNLPIVGCNYPKRSVGAGFTALSKDREARIQTTEESTGVEECYYTGFGFCLIQRHVFEKLMRPWFLIGYNKTTNTYTTEDAAFAHTLYDQTDVKWYVDHDASKLLGHIGSHKFTFAGVDNVSL